MLITGFLRSGTTLLEKHLHNHPQLCVASQPLPYLFHQVKKNFLTQLNEVEDSYPLGTLFREWRYSRGQFTAYLTKQNILKRELSDILISMKEYSGQLTPEILNLEPISGSLSEVFTSFMTEYSLKILRKKAVFFGAKEVFCEEYSDYFLEQKIPVIVIIRDPRDVVASVHLGRGDRYVNKNLSVLHIVRSWRKSVAYAIAYRNHPLFHSLRYENLITSTMATLGQITSKLGLSAYPKNYTPHKLIDQSGQIWNGNSSFPKIHQRRASLPPEIQQLIETICAPEMKWLGYDAPRHNVCDTLTSFRDLFQPSTPALTEEQRQDEYARLAMIGGQQLPPKSLVENENWFIHSTCFEELRQQMT